jgi:hypothetical protein
MRSLRPALARPRICIRDLLDISGGTMNVKSLSILALVFLFAIPTWADGKKKNQSDRAMLEKMEAVPCGAKEQGLTGLGSLWASIGVTHVNSDEKLCPQYLIRTDDMEYHIRPTDNKHPVILPVGHEVVFKIKKDRMYLKVPDGGDHKTRAYRVVAVNQSNSDDDSQRSTAKSQ